MSFGAKEIIVILIVGLILFGSSKIPEFARSLRKGIEEFKKTGEELSKGIEAKDDGQAKK
ncbi:MAG TPA: twin-arginine translocase TatA/TatE family subunit [Caldisericia bacterium]|nr:twin-arginine translocase TatA/TatE family subunit [Caldisericales bacterium]HOR46354.1 twin-arginine translocase TatA/TatE family subunit [Caldisericia bacterium]HOU08327.1 twin-arginine translocase TatA/TatE family subunit [Caldisericia bacterium]HPL88824.1 twin-arginine translocase TatA/TatE family subunit [Caldisericia bacterium]HQG59932.1 twin-arginine translocase TatA/TatE family subunit [Caldisericia bacterium]